MPAPRDARPRSLDELTEAVIGASISIHQIYGPGMFESAYEALLAHRLTKAGIAVARQHSVPLKMDGVILNECFRVDLLIEQRLVVELKSVNKLTPLDSQQALTYIRLLELPLALVVNFGQERLVDGVKRVVNKLKPSDSPSLHVNKSPSE